MEWRYLAAALAFLAAAGLAYVVYDPWGLFLGYTAYAFIAIALALVYLGVRWIIQARREAAA
jgi:hypothetical protein